MLAGPLVAPARAPGTIGNVTNYPAVCPSASATRATSRRRPMARCGGPTTWPTRSGSSIPRTQMGHVAACPSPEQKARRPGSGWDRRLSAQGCGLPTKGTTPSPTPTKLSATRASTPRARSLRGPTARCGYQHRELWGYRRRFDRVGHHRRQGHRTRPRPRRGHRRRDRPHPPLRIVIRVQAPRRDRHRAGLRRGASCRPDPCTASLSVPPRPRLAGGCREIDSMTASRVTRRVLFAAAADRARNACSGA